MTLTALLYVSKSLLDPVGSDGVIADVLDKARANNARLDVSGALIHAGQRFAQLLEGDRTTIDRLFAGIAADPRHQDVVVLDEWSIDRRLFGGWSMAYSGSSAYVGRTLSKPLAETLRGSMPDTQRLLRIMVQFTTAPPFSPSV